MVNLVGLLNCLDKNSGKPGKLFEVFKLEEHLEPHL